MIIYGQRDATEARKIHNSLQRWHDPEQKDLELVFVDSANQGARLLDKTVALQITQFIQRRLIDLKDRYPWRERINPLGGGQ